MTKEVFLSYARRDILHARALYRWLRESGFQPFMDERSLIVGRPWVTSVEQAIDRADAVLILIGPHGFGNTQQQERELAFFKSTKEQNFLLIPVLLPGCTDPPTGFLSLRMWADLSFFETIPNKAEQLDELLEALRGGVASPNSVPDNLCPYVGLETFREEDTAFYYGRDKEIKLLAEKVESYPFVAVVGPSGSGKSSLVQAGLFPVLRQNYNERPWRIISVRFETRPLHELLAAIAISNYALGVQESGPTHKLEDLLLSNIDERLGEVAEFYLAQNVNEGCRTLLHLDSWEQLYADTDPQDAELEVPQKRHVAEKVIDFLLYATDKNLAQVVLTVRADSYGTLLKHARLSRFWPAQQVNIPVMSRDDLHQVVTKPASAANLRFEPPELVTRILDDAGEEPGVLPLLQYALKRTWENSKPAWNGPSGRVLTERAYRAVGGVKGVLQHTAEKIYYDLTPEQRTVLPRLMLRLISSEKGQSDRLVRIKLPDDPIQRAIVDKMSGRDARLLMTSARCLGAPEAPKGDCPTHETRSSGSEDLLIEYATVEITHAALLETWDRLRKWIEQHRDRLNAKSIVQQKMEEWEENGKQDRYLLAYGLQLERAKDLVGNPGYVDVNALRSYVDASDRRVQQDIAENHRRTALEYAGNIERAAAEIYRMDKVLEEATRDIKRAFGFDFVSIQLVDKLDGTVKTAFGIGQKGWYGISKHSFKGRKNLQDIQSLIVTSAPPVIEVISGNDKRFDQFIYKKFRHDLLSRAFMPIVFSGSYRHLEEAQWEFVSDEPIVDVRTPKDRRALLMMNAEEYRQLLVSGEYDVIGTLEVGFNNPADVIQTEDAVDVFRRISSHATAIRRASLDAVLKAVARCATRFVKADAARIGFGHRGEEDTFLYEASIGGGSEIEQFCPSDALSKHALSSGRAVFVSDDNESGETSLRQDVYWLQSKFRSVVAVPIICDLEGTRDLEYLQSVDGSPNIDAGVLYVFCKHKHVFTAGELAWLEFFARRASSAITNARYFVEVREEGRKLSNLHNVAMTLSRDDMKSNLLEDIAGSALNMFGADLVTVYEYDAERRRFLNNFGSAGYRIQPVVPMEICDDVTFAPRRVLSARDNIYAADARRDDRLRPSGATMQDGMGRFLAREEVISSAGIKLVCGDKNVGVMFINFRTAHDFSARERKLVETLAATAAIAIRNRRFAGANSSAGSQLDDQKACSSSLEPDNFEACEVPHF